MNILEKYLSMAKGKTVNIGIGLSDSELHDQKILNASLQLLSHHNIQIYLFGVKNSIITISSNSIFEKNKMAIKLVESVKPEKKIVECLKNKTLDAIVRGSLSSSKFLSSVRKILGLKEINRLALMETVDGFQFFYGPVGIDECNNFEKKVDFIKKALIVLESLKLTPKISVLSGGREGDVGRDVDVDKTIKTAIKVVSHFKKEIPGLEIYHDEILIENAVEKQSNLIIAPDGISGNLIYRTLVHLGGGKAHGAIYMNSDDVIIDTSRVGKLSEIHGALLLALALSR